MKPMPPPPEELLQSWWFATDYCSQSEPFETPVSRSILTALGKHYRLVPAPPEIPPGVSSWRWDDEWSPTAPATMSAREAAVWILHAANWAVILESHDELDPMDPLVFYGLVERLEDAEYVPGWRRTSKLASHLIAWVTSRLEKKGWCTNELHHDEMIPFNDCYHGDDPESPCEWDECWALVANPEGLIAVALEIIRDGWEPPEPDAPIEPSIDGILTTLRFLQGGWIWDGADSGNNEYLRDAIAVLRAWDPSAEIDMTCPLCQEWECDTGCPMEQHRKGARQ